MKFRLLSYVIIGVVTFLLLGFVSVIWVWRSDQTVRLPQSQVVQARRPAIQLTFPPNPQVKVGTPVEGPTITPRYTYRNEFPTDRSKPLPLYVIDTQNGRETRLGDDSGAAVFGTMDEHSLLWYFGCDPDCSALSGGVYAYSLATGANSLVFTHGNPSIHPQIAGDWVAFGDFNGDGTQTATLYAANLQTHEIITLTQELNARDAYISKYFGISARLAAWYDIVHGKPVGLVIYDLASHIQLAKLTTWESAFNEQNVVVYDVAAGETVITWNGVYGYDLVTQSYFRISDFFPPNWVIPPIFDKGRITEKGRVLSRTLSLKDGTQRTISAPLLDATPSAAPCVEGQNLVQNGDLEDSAAHNLWQQSGSPSDVIVNDLPPNSPQAGQWAIRLGRYSNAQQTIQQTLNIPSNVKHITLAFDVRASSWDIWGGDQLQVDLIDPITNQSILVTPMQWTNRQLANGGWIPLQVDLQDWPGIDTPLYLVFRATTDWAFPTDFTLDNIRFLTACH
ncbi:MAG: hypothetical protein U0350_14045 [Caldilineaceae bacterium]